MFPLSSLSSSARELWRLEFQLRSAAAADPRVKLSGSRPGNTRQGFKNLLVSVSVIIHRKEKNTSGFESRLLSAGAAQILDSRSET